MPSPLTLDTIDIVGPQAYAERGYPHDDWALLRRESPVHWYERPGLEPFWAVTRHEDILRISRQPRLLQNEPRLAVFPDIEAEFDPDNPDDDIPFRHLLNMDPPEHGRYRRLVSGHFTPRALKKLTGEVDRIACDLLDGIALAGHEGEMDFVAELSAKLPLAVLADMLGVPRQDWELMFKWTNETIGSTDPEYQQEGESALDTVERSRTALFEYFMNMVQQRRSEPRADIVSVISNATLDGAEIPPLEHLSYYFLLVVAGNETTRNAISGGLLALIEHPGELERLRADPGLLDSAVEEIVRWTTPVIQFCRTAAEDCEIRGQKILAGQNLALFYPSANRDEDVYPDPFAFRVDRSPNPHLGFGIGEHFCLGANLARLELRVTFRRLLERLEHVELAGPVARLRSSFVGGIKSMPVRYRLRSSKGSKA